MKQMWKTKKLKEVVDLCDAGTWGPESATGMPLLRSSNMQDGQLIVNDLKFIDVPKTKQEKYTLKEGDTLITKSSGSTKHIGKSLYITKEMDSKFGFSNFTQRLRPKKDLVLPEWIYYKISNPATRLLLLEASQTTTGLRNLKIPALKDLEIPLPPLQEQKRIVEKIEQLTAKINEAKKLRQQTQQDAADLVPAALHKIFSEGKKKEWKEESIGNVCIINPKKSELQTVDDQTEVAFVAMNAVSDKFQYIMGHGVRKFEEVKKGYTYFKKGDVLFAKITPCMENGKVAHANSIHHEIGFGSTEFHVLRAKPGKILPEFIYHIVRSKNFREEAEKRMTGSAGQKRVPKEFLEKYKIFLPTLAEQKNIVNYLNSLSEKTKQLQSLQSQTAGEFDALSQSILTKAFEGKL